MSPSPLGTPQTQTNKRKVVPRLISRRFLCTCLFVRAGGGSREPWYDGPRPIPAVVASVPFAVFLNVFCLCCCLCCIVGGIEQGPSLTNSFALRDMGFMVVHCCNVLVFVICVTFHVCVLWQWFPIVSLKSQTKYKLRPIYVTNVQALCDI